MKALFIENIYRIYNTVMKIYYFRNNVIFRGECKIRGVPAINIVRGGELIVGDGVVFNSRPKNYHANMACGVKILIDAPNAKITIGNLTRINGACLHAKKSIVIGDRCLIASGVNILDSNGHRTSMEIPEERIHSVDVPRAVVVGNDVWLGLNVTILPGVVIGHGCVVGAGVAVREDIPDNTVVNQLYQSRRI